MARTIMIQGTASDTGKSFIVAGLCRIFAEDGYKVAPFKSQNMALNSYITEDDHEIAKSIAMQAFCAKTKPDVKMNPILLKPVSNIGSQLIVEGKYVATMKGQEYYKYKKALKKNIMSAFNQLSKENDIVVIEGAGSPAEINLKQDDIVNMGMAKMAGAPVILVGDIDRGGVFAAIAGTLLLLDDHEKDLVKGVIINKFKGELEILKPGLTMLEDIIKKPVLGVVPYADISIEKEDSLAQKTENKPNSILTVGIVKLPRMTNFTEFDGLSVLEAVELIYITKPTEIDRCNLVIIPGTTSLIDDFHWLNTTGMDKKIKDYANEKGKLLGISEGYVMLCKNIIIDHVALEGLGLIKADATINGVSEAENKIEEIETDNDLFKDLLKNKFYGGNSTISFTIKKDLSDQPAYIVGVKNHGLFDSQWITQNLLENLFADKKGAEQIKAVDVREYYENEYNKLAKILREHLDMEAIYKILNKEI